jgi:hypothetical protein
MAVRVASEGVRFDAMSRGYCEDYLLIRILVSTHADKLNVIGAVARALTSLDELDLQHPSGVEIEFRFTTGEPAGGIVMPRADAELITKEVVSNQDYYDAAVIAPPVPSASVPGP